LTLHAVRLQRSGDGLAQESFRLSRRRSLGHQYPLRRAETYPAALGFSERITGGHYIFARQDIIEIINLQPLRGGKAKAYQVKQVRQLIAKYGLVLTE
jgi:hypothetical protein